MQAPDELLSTLRAGPERLEAKVRGLPRAVLLWPPSPGAPSILEIVCRLRDAESEFWLESYRRLAEADHPELPVFDAAQRGLEGEHRQAHLAESLRAWRRARRETLTILAALQAPSWERRAARAGGGTASVLELVQQQCAEDAVQRQAIDASLERYAVRERMLETLRELRRLVPAAPSESWSRRAAPGSATPLEQLCRLRDLEQRVLEHCAAIAHEERPRLVPLDVAALGATLRYAAQDPSTVLRELERRRGLFLQLLHALPPRAWQRRGVHAVRGESTLAEIVAHHLDREAAGLAELRASLRVALTPIAAPSAGI